MEEIQWVYVGYNMVCGKSYYIYESIDGMFTKFVDGDGSYKIVENY